MLNPFILYIFWINFDWIKESFILLWKRFSYTSWNLIDNIKSLLSLGSNSINYIWESSWHIVKNSFNVSYINYSTFINMWLIILFVIISILILMKWLWPVWNKLSWNNNEMETKNWIKWIFSLFSTFLSKISKYVISFVFVILLTLLLSFIAKKIIDNGDYGFKTGNKILVENNTPLLFNHFVGNINKIMFDKNNNYLIDNKKKYYWPTYINSYAYVKNGIFNSDDPKLKINPYNVTKTRILNGGFNQEAKFVYSKWAWSFDIYNMIDNLNNQYNSSDENNRASPLRPNADNLWWFNLSIKLDNTWNIWNKENILFNLDKKNSEILSEITNNKKIISTRGKDTYISITFNLKNIDVINWQSFKVSKANNLLSGHKITYIYKYTNDETGIKDKLDNVYICLDLTSPLSLNVLNTNEKCISFNTEEYNLIERKPFIIHKNWIIVNDYWSLLGSMLLLSNTTKKNKNFIKDQIIHNNIADLWLETLPLQFSYKYTLWISSISPSDNSQITLWTDDYNTNLLYKYTPSFMLSLVYLEKITWKSALNALSSNSNIRNYYNKYFLFAEGNSIKYIYINDDSNTLSSYLTINPNELINLVWAEANWNKNPYKLWMVSTKTSVTPLSLFPNEISSKVFYWWKLVDNRLLPTQLDILIKEMITIPIYYYYQYINPTNVSIHDRSYVESYKNTNKIYSYLFNFSWLVYKSFFVWIFKWLLYLMMFFAFAIFWFSSLFTKVLSIGSKKIEKGSKDTTKQISNLSWDISNSKWVQIIFIIIWLVSFYILYDRALILFVFASLIWIFLIWRENKGNQEVLEKKGDDESKDNAKVQKSINSNNLWNKIKWASVAIKSGWKNLLKKAVRWKNKWQEISRNIGLMLINLAANAYSFVLISLIVYLIITSLMVYFNGWQLLTFNKWLGIFPDFMLLIFVLSWMAAIFSFQWRLSSIISWFIVNQISWQNSFFNNFLQSHLDKSTFNKVTMGKNSITDAVIKNMKVWLNKIEEQSENDKFKKVLKGIKGMKKWVTDHFDKWLDWKNKKMILVSDFIEKWHLGGVVNIANNLKDKIDINKMKTWSKEKVSQLKQRWVTKLNLLGVNTDNLTAEELDSLLLNSVLDESKKNDLYELMKSKGLNDETIETFISDLEKKIKDSYNIKLSVVPKTIDKLIQDSQENIKWRNFYNTEESVSKVLDNEAKILWLNTTSESYLNLRTLTNTLYKKDMNIGWLLRLSKLFNNNEVFNKAIPFISDFTNSKIDIIELTNKIEELLKNENLTEAEKQKIIGWIVDFKSTIVNNDLKNINKLSKDFIWISWKKWPVLSLLKNTLYWDLQTNNIVKFKQEKKEILDTINYKLLEKYPNWVPENINDIVEQMKKTSNFTVFNNLLNNLYSNKIIDDETFKGLNETGLQQYTHLFNNILWKIGNGDNDIQDELWTMKELLEKLDPEKNKKLIEQINNFIDVTNGFDVTPFNWMDNKIKQLTINSLLSTKKDLSSIINNSNIPNDKKESLVNLVNSKLSWISSSIKWFYEWKINKSELLWKITILTDFIEKEFNSNWIDLSKLSLDANMLIDTLDKIKWEGEKNLNINKERIKDQVNQYVNLLSLNDQNVLTNLIGGTLETISWHENYDEIIKSLREGDEKKILWLNQTDVNKDNIDLITYTSDSLINKNLNKVTDIINNNMNILQDQSLSKEERERMLKENKRYNELKENIIKEQKIIQENWEEYNIIELKKKELELKKKNTSDKEVLKAINSKLIEEEQKIKNIEKNMNKIISNVDTELVSSTKYNKDEILRTKGLMTEYKIKWLGKAISPLIEQYVSKDFSIDKEENKDEISNAIDNVLLKIMEGWEIWFIEELIKVKDKYIDKDNQEKFINETLSLSSEFLHNKNLSHLINSPYLDNFLNLDKISQEKLLKEISGKGEKITRVIDNWWIKYLIEDWKYLDNSIDIIDLAANKTKIINDVKNVLSESSESMDKDLVYNFLTSWGKDIDIKDKEKIIEKLKDEVIKEEDENKQKEKHKLLEEIKIIMDLNYEDIEKTFTDIKKEEKEEAQIEEEVKKETKKLEQIEEKGKALKTRYKENITEKKEIEDEIDKGINSKEIEDEKKKIETNIQNIKETYPTVKKALNKKKRDVKVTVEKKKKITINKKKNMNTMNNFFVNRYWSSNYNEDLLKKSSWNELLNKNNNKVKYKENKIWKKVSDNIKQNNNSI